MFKHNMCLLISSGLKTRYILVYISYLGCIYLIFMHTIEKGF